MSTDLEWYLNVGGKQSGPLAAKEIVEMVRAGKIPATAQVTAARMGGDWVTAQDLIDAYDELYTKKPTGPAMPITGTNEAGAPVSFASTPSSPFTNSAADPNFSPPPRPTEHLERSKIIILDRSAGEERPPDATEALFQAIQAVREKANQKAGPGGAAHPNPATGSKDSWGQLQRPAGNRLPPQLLFVIVVAGILGALVYGFSGIIGKKSGPTKPQVVEAPTPPEPPPARPNSNAALLNTAPVERVRTAPIVQPRSPGPSADRRERAERERERERERDREEERLERGGGARYRDERDPPLENSGEDAADVDETEPAPEGQVEMGDPADPSNIDSDKMIPEPGTMPGMRDRQERMESEP